MLDNVGHWMSLAYLFISTHLMGERRHQSKFPACPALLVLQQCQPVGKDRPLWSLAGYFLRLKKKIDYELRWSSGRQSNIEAHLLVFYATVF